MATRIERLIGEIQRDPFSGIGKPAPLKGELSWYRSRLIELEAPVDADQHACCAGAPLRCMAFCAA
jgi:YoeB-like toxin of bacterial type II toxin-antitoxin system